LDFINRVKKTLIENLKKNLTPGTNVARLAKNWDNIYNMNKTLESSDVINAGSTNIIKRESTPYGQSSPSEFYQGSINPLNKGILRQNINIDTRFRDNYYTTTASNFHVDLPLRLTEVVSLQLSAFEIPNTFYVISQVFGNNFFVLETPGVEPLVVTIPDGNYDYLGLQNYINNFLGGTGVPSAYNGIQFIADVNTSGGLGPQGGSGKMIVGLTSTATITSFSINFFCRV
jgi:hypothetical protein